MSKYSVLVVEDSQFNRKMIIEYVHQHPDFEVISELSDGRDLLQKVAALKPDLVLLDIHMPYQDGVDAIKQCRVVYPDLAFIFITGSEDFATEAFDLNAVDYVLKPFEQHRVFKALEKAKRRFQFKNASLQPINKSNQKIEVKFGNEIYFISLKDILFIEKIDRKILIHTRYKIYENVETLEQFKKVLNKDFITSHRSFIINVKHLSHIKVSGNSYFVYFYNYEKYAQISKQKMESIKDYIKQIG